MHKMNEYGANIIYAQMHFNDEFGVGGRRHRLPWANTTHATCVKTKLCKWLCRNRQWHQVSNNRYRLWKLRTHRFRSIANSCEPICPQNATPEFCRSRNGIWKIFFWLRKGILPKFVNGVSRWYLLDDSSCIVKCIVLSADYGMLIARPKCLSESFR